MVQNPPTGYQSCVPYLVYADAPAALEFLVRAYGFRERFRMEMAPGQIGHAELENGDSVVFVATAFESMGCASAKDLPALHAMVLCYVDDVDAHHAKARAEGATILAEPATQPHGDRIYRSKDLEGQIWTFATHVEDVDITKLKSPE